MQLVWPYQVFRLLSDIALVICRQQLRAYRGVNDVKQDTRCLVRYHVIGKIARKVAHERLRHTRIDAIH